MFRLEITRRAEKELGRLPPTLRERVAKALDGLLESPRPPRSKKLRGLEAYSLRVGEYRIVYLVDDAQRLVTVVRVKHRRDVYRGL